MGPIVTQIRSIKFIFNYVYQGESLESTKAIHNRLHNFTFSHQICFFISGRYPGGASNKSGQFDWG